MSGSSNNNSTVNSQITDAVTLNSVGVIGESPAFAMGIAYQGLSQAFSLAALNATNNQQNGQTIGNAVTSTAVTMILNIGQSISSGGGGGNGNK